jgi:hypothetical protein
MPSICGACDEGNIPTKDGMHKMAWRGYWPCRNYVKMAYSVNEKDPERWKMTAKDGGHFWSKEKQRGFFSNLWND